MFIENGITRYYTVERRGIGILKTKHGKFWQYNFVIDDQWKKYSVIVKAELNQTRLIPAFKRTNQLVLRTDSGCETGQVFGDLTCECHEQLHLALKTIEDIGEGIIIHIPHQDGRGMGLTFKLATLWLQDVLELNTVESAMLLAPSKAIDVRTYSGVICILKFFDIPKTCKIHLMTNAPRKTKVFTENGYTVDYLPIVVKPNKYTKIHLKAKQEYLGHKGLIKEGENVKAKAIDQILTRMKTHNTLLCCGLDPDLKKIPFEIMEKKISNEEKILEFLRTVVDITAPHVCVYKVQKAFFDVLSGGHDVLKELISYIHTLHKGIPIIVDCKIGDINNTMTAYIHKTCSMYSKQTAL